MKKLYRFYWDCGRMGDVEGTFVEDDVVVKRCIGKRVYFGEILGKHSEIYGNLDENDLEVLTDEQDFIEKFEKWIGSVGHNPIHIIQESEDEEEE